MHNDLMNVLLGGFVSKAESRIVLGQARSFGDGASDRPGRGRFEEFPLAVVM